MAQRGFIKITPFDGLFFGKGRPFNMGDDTWTEADLLPQPGVVWGAIFSQLWYRNRDTKLDALKIGRIMLMGENVTQLYLPAPLDMFQTDDGTMYHHQFYWQEDEHYIHRAVDKNVLLKPFTNETVEPAEQMLISVGSLKEYAGADKIFSCKMEPVNKHIKTEFKIGISRNSTTRVADEGMLYTVHLAHLKEGYSLVVEAEYPEHLPSEGILKLGGEVKLARFQVLEPDAQEGRDIQQALTLPTSSEVVGFFKVYLTTPAPLNNKGFPIFLENKPFSIEAGVTGKPYPAGGFDLKAVRPKPKAMLAPAGSVYIVEYTGNTGKCTPQDAKDLIGNGLNTQGFNQFEIIPYYGDKN